MASRCRCQHQLQLQFCNGDETMAPFFVKRLLLALVLLGISILFIFQARREEDNKPWYKPRWMRSGGLYLAGAIMLIGGSILLVIAIFEALGR